MVQPLISPISVSALPCKTRGTEITSFHLNIVHYFADKRKTHSPEKNKMLSTACLIADDICCDAVVEYLIDNVH